MDSDFWQQDVMENLGFAGGMILQGYLTGGLGTLLKGTSLYGKLPAALKLFGATDDAMKAFKASNEASKAFKLAKALKADGLADDAIGNVLSGKVNLKGTSWFSKLAPELQAEANMLKNSQRLQMFARMAPGVVTESSLEAQDYKDNALKTFEEDLYSMENTVDYMERAMMEMGYDGSTEIKPGSPEYQALERRVGELRQEDYARMKSEINKSSFLQFGLNVALLAATDGFSWGRLFNKNKTSGVGASMRRWFKGSLEDGMKVKSLLGEKAIDLAKGVVAEGGQEMAQSGLAKFAEMSSERGYDKQLYRDLGLDNDPANLRNKQVFEDFAMNPNNVKKTANIFGMLGESLLDTIGDPNSWMEFTIGGLTGGIFPFFSIKSDVNQRGIAKKIANDFNTR
ncbi:MAG: hypothetical protein LBE56_12810 [Tannerella sp.]|nr:hypothetical protein [Tannerella sp.]